MGVWFSNVRWQINFNYDQTIKKLVKSSQLLQENTKYCHTFVFDYSLIFVGLLGVAMEFQDTETDFDFRTQNKKLIPIMIKQSKNLSNWANYCNKIPNIIILLYLIMPLFL